MQGLVRKRDHFWSVTLFLVNGQAEPKKLRDTAWLFQPELSRASRPTASRSSTATPHQKDPGKSDPVTFAEEQEMAMLYRHHVEFGVGHGVSIHADCPEGVCDRADRLSTSGGPDLRGAAHHAADRRRLAQAGRAGRGHEGAGRDADRRTGREAAARWSPPMRRGSRSGRPTSTKPDMALYQKPGQSALERCREALKRIEAGLTLLDEDEKAAEAFRFANLAMWQQRSTRSISLKRRRDEPVDERTIDVPANRSWYPFQFAFILLNLPGITKLDHPDRSERPKRWPTCSGSPRAAARPKPTWACRPTRWACGGCKAPVAGRSGENGVAVLMRYTLRLLTIQQFQRATALICACEVIRRGDEKKWGKEPFRIGLWVGQKTTPNTTDQAAEAIKQEHGGKFKGTGQRLAAQLTNCPWCGAKIDPGKHIKVESYAKGRCRTFSFCGDVLGRCPFSAKQLAAGGHAGGGGGRGDLPPPADAADRHGGQVRPDAVERQGADALRPGRRLLRPPRLPLARDRRTPTSHPKKDKLPAGQDARRTRCCGHPT